MIFLFALVRETLSFSFRFLLTEFLGILLRVAVPVTIGGAALYLLLDAYCLELLAYLSRPSDDIASRILGMAAAGVLVMFLLNAVVVASLARLISKDGAPERSFFGIGSAAWRIYTANLRLLLILVIGAAIFWLSSLALNYVLVLPNLNVIRVGIFGVLYWLGVRCWFFVAPLSLPDREINPIAASWRRSAGYSWLIAVTMFLLLVLFVVFLVAGEFLLRWLNIFLIFQPTTFRDSTLLFQRNLLPMAILVSVAYLLGTILLTAARVYLFRRLTEDSLSV